MNLLLIDDDQPTLTSLQTFLAGTSYSLQAFQNPLKALEAFDNEHFDAVISDISMPEMNGIEVLKHIRTKSPSTYVMLLTGYANVPNAIAAVNHGAYRFLRKPLRMEKLMTILEELEADLQTLNRKSNGNGHASNSIPHEPQECDNCTTKSPVETENAQSDRKFSHKRQSLELLGTLATGIVHDFNNRLAVIQPCVEMIQQLGKQEALQKWTTRLEKSARQAFDFTNKLRQIIYHDPDPKKQESINIEQIVIDVRSSMLPLVKKNLIIDTELLAELPVIRGNYGQICQIVMNLISNARDAVAKNQFGTLTISLNNQMLDSDAAHKLKLPAGKYLKLVVTDDGAGIPSDVIPYIFDPFVTTKTNGHGTGLGLAVIHELVEAHRGSIDVQSKLGEGTTFTVLLPQYQEKAAG